MGLATIRTRDFLIETKPSLELLAARMPCERRVVRIADRNDPAAPDHTPHLLQGGDRVGEMLQHLMRMDDVPRRVFAIQSVDISNSEIDTWMIAACSLDRIRGGIDTPHLAGTQTCGKVCRDCPGTAADVEHVQASSQIWHQITRGV